MHEKKLRKNLDSKNQNLNFVLFDLNHKAQKIKNGYLIKDCINSLSEFIDNSKMGYSH